MSPFFHMCTVIRKSQAVISAVAAASPKPQKVPGEIIPRLNKAKKRLVPTAKQEVKKGGRTRISEQGIKKAPEKVKKLPRSQSKSNPGAQRSVEGREVIGMSSLCI
ncbi:uncharacterized protein LOC144608249 [Rhinoraja longicauda]